jgi:hypothetical protein
MLRLERLDQDAIALDFGCARLVHRLECPRQQQHRNVRQVGMRLHEGRDFVAAPLRHADVGQDDVGPLGLDARDRLLAVADCHDLDILARERQLDDALDGHAVVGQQKLLSH